MLHRSRDLFAHYAQGLLMGGADVIPGVSGGTMALIVGIYERLIDALSHAYSVVLNLARGNMAEVRRHWRAVEWRLVLPLALGIATAIVLASKIIPTLLERYPAHMRGLFFGLVAASIGVPWLRIGRTTAGLVVYALAAAVLAFFLTGLPALNASEPSLLRVFGSAAIAICAMILPGVSGAFLLEAMGIYRATLEALNALDVAYVGVFIAGIVVGLGVFSKLLNFLLTRYPDRTMAALIGLMAGSLRALWPWQTPDRTLLWPDAADPVLMPLLLLLLGFAFVAALTWWGQRRIAATA